MADNSDRAAAMAAVRLCYSTWAQSYFDEYFGEGASYPPVHQALVRNLLAENHTRVLLDAGCGPASLLRGFVDMGMDLYGFDLTPEMVAEAKKVMTENGVVEKHFWQGDVTDPAAFRLPLDGSVAPDAVISIGVFPHIPETQERKVIENLFGAVRPGGLVAIEARNQFFSLFTLNRYSYEFFASELLDLPALRAKAGDESDQLNAALKEIEQRFRMDLPPVRKGKKSELGYDQVLSRTHNPLILRQSFEDAGFVDVRVLFYHFHCLPPMLEASIPELFRRASLEMEDPEDWRGYFMASAFVIAARRPD